MAAANDDRARILLRRSAFLGSALAAIGCAPARPASAPGESSQVAVPPARTESDLTPASDRSEKAADPDAEMPSLEMPPNVGPTAKERFQRLFGMAEKQNRLLDELDELVPDCGVLDTACERRWQSFAAKYNELKMAQTFMSGCPGSSADAKLYAEREREHFDHLREREKRIVDRVQQLLDRDGKAGQERFARLQEEAYQAAPYPCLSIACEDW